MKFSHISDIHLGFSQYGLDEREVDVYQAFDQAIEKSIEDKVEFVIFAGDIFHTPNPKGKPQIKLASALKRLNENKIESYFVLGENDTWYRPCLQQKIFLHPLMILICY